MEEQLYTKKGRKYIPIGYSNNFTGFPADGIWVVYNKPGCHSSTCIAQVGQFKNIDYSIFASLIKDKKDKLIKILSKQEPRSYDQIANEILEEIIK